MAFIVSQHIEGHYEVELGEPEKTWLEILEGKMLTTKESVLAFAITEGMINLFHRFAQPYRLTT